MADVKNLYEPNDGWGWSNYDPMVNAFGNVIIQVEVGSYQGDTFVLYEKNEKIGHLVFGWGSCSCCDALMGCTNYEALQDLCDYLENSIKWFDTKKEALEWFKTHDWEGDWYWYKDECRDYVNRAIKYLEGENEG